MATSARAAEEVGERMAKEKEAEVEGFRAKRKRVVREGTASTSSSKKKRKKHSLFLFLALAAFSTAAASVLSLSLLMMPACVVPLPLALLLFDSNSSPSFSILSLFSPLPPFRFSFFSTVQGKVSPKRERRRKNSSFSLSLSRGAEPATYKDDVFVGGRRFLERERERSLLQLSLLPSFLECFSPRLAFFLFFTLSFSLHSIFCC